MTTTTPPKPTFKRGDVVLVLFPNSDLRTAKTRPALIVQAEDLQTGLPQVIVAMITSKVFRANHPSHVLVRLNSDQGKQSGLLTDSVMMTEPMQEIDKALRHTLGLKDEPQKLEG